MKKYEIVDVSEKQLEDLIRQGADLIEEGLRFVDHQRMTDRGPLDVLLIDSGNALIVAELKVVEDDGMLLQGIDYYDYVSRNVEGMARAYKAFGIDPTQQIRLLLVAPSFSQSLLNRCKWIDIPISLFGYNCVRFEGSDDISPVFHEITIPSPPEPPVESYRIEDKYNYVTNVEARERMIKLIAEVERWEPGTISIEPIKYDISLKVNGRVFAYVAPRRKFFHVYTFDHDNKWTGYAVNQEEDLEPIWSLLRTNIERKGT